MMGRDPASEEDLKNKNDGNEELKSEDGIGNDKEES